MVFCPGCSCFPVTGYVRSLVRVRFSLDVQWSGLCALCLGFGGIPDAASDPSGAGKSSRHDQTSYFAHQLVGDDGTHLYIAVHTSTRTIHTGLGFLRFGRDFIRMPANLRLEKAVILLATSLLHVDV